MTRPDWDTYFMGICRAVAARSIDAETQVGCVIVNPQRRIVSTGYNAFPAGVNDEFWPRRRQAVVLVPAVGVARRGDISAEELQSVEYDWRRDPHYHYQVDKYAAMTHAEMNAIVSAQDDLHGCTLYTELFPCHECAKAIITAGITRIVYAGTREDKSWAVAKELFIQAGVELVGPEKP